MEHLSSLMAAKSLTIVKSNARVLSEMQREEKSSSIKRKHRNSTCEDERNAGKRRHKSSSKLESLGRSGTNVRPRREEQAGIGSSKDVTSTSRDDNQKSSGSIESLKALPGADPEPSMVPERMDHVAEVMRKSSAGCAAPNRHLILVDSDERESTKTEIIRQGQSTEHVSTYPNEDTQQFQPAKEGVEQHQSGTAYARRRRRRRDKRRGQQDRREHMAEIRVGSRSFDATADHVSPFRAQRMASGLNPRLSMNPDQAETLGLPSHELPGRGHLQHFSSSRHPELLSVSNLFRSKKDGTEDVRTPDFQQNDEQDIIMENNGNDNWKANERAMMEGEASKNLSELVCLTENDIKQIVKTLKFDMQQSYSKEAELLLQVEDLKNKLNDAGSSEAQLVRTNFDLNSNLSQTRSANADLEEQARSLCESEAQLQESIKTLTDKLQSSRSEKGALTRKVDLLESSLASHSTEKAELQQQISKLEKITKVELEQQRKHIDEQAESIRMREVSGAYLTNELRSVTERHQEAIDEISRLKSLNECLSTKVISVEEHGAKLQSCLDDTSEMLHKATTTAAGLGSHNALLKSECERALKQIQSSNTDLLSVTAKHDQAVSKIQELTQNNARLLWEYENLRQTTTRLHGDLHSMTKRHDNAVSNIIDLHSRSSRFKSAHEQVESQVIRLESELSRKAAEAGEKANEVKQLKSRISGLEEVLRRAKRQESEVKAELSRRTAEHVKVVNNAKQLNDRIAHLENVRNEAHTKATGIREPSKTMTKQGKAVGDANRLTYCTTILAKEKNDTQNQAAGLESELSNATVTCADVVNEAKGFKAVKNGLQKDCHNVREKARDLQFEISDAITKHPQGVSKMKVLTYNNTPM